LKKVVEDLVDGGFGDIHIDGHAVDVPWVVIKMVPRDGFEAVGQPWEGVPFEIAGDPPLILGHCREGGEQEKAIQ
jgi:hypothetical protein